ncbi:DUF2459 domain-containing protein [Aquimarina sp. 2201CG14-23]|uniref:DUF2459 domain-containing protein n=1 Tax=Aquimarina mycalae TaxID=3040073 RepID=UPI0024781494|nr:DUF2459 domain-containing protein [Aquimarina sp. 2201CG14-23]MDH7444812.1 DUF2459 domain-containing protein [Aquimarina sp. 2201CG14-23]
MQIIKKTLKYLAALLIIPVLYFTVATLCSYIAISPKATNEVKDQSIYLASNGIHLEIIIPKTDISTTLLQGLVYNKHEQYVSFGWGEKTYYTKAATSLHFNTVNRFQAALLKTPSLMHITRYTALQNHWIEIKITAAQLIKLQTYIDDSFKKDIKNNKSLLPGITYGTTDNFYEAKGNYHCFNTCNTWVNTGFKQSDIKACLWTPFDFGLLQIHRNK